MDELTALVERYPGAVNTPVIIFILGFAAFVFYFGCRRTLSLPPGQLGKNLAACFKVGSYLMVFCCLWGCVLLGGQTSFAKQNRPINPMLAAAVGISWLLIVVPCVFRDHFKKKNGQGGSNQINPL